MMRNWFGCGALLLALAACGERGAESADRDAAGDSLSVEERREIGGRIVFVSERDGNAEVYTIAPSGEGLARLTQDSASDYPAAAAPDGGALLVVSVAEVNADQVERMLVLPLGGASGGAAIGPASARARSPSWGPRGEWLAFESDRESFRDIYRIARDGTGLTRLTDNPQGNFEPDVSPDGSMIAFASSRDGDAEVYVMRADGEEERRLTAFHRDDWGPRWSPDGRWIAFLSNREGADRVFLVRPDGTGLRRLTEDADSAAPADSSGGPGVQEADFAWSPDGRRVAFTRRTRAGESRVRVVDVQSGATFDVRGTGGRDAQPAWSPDGRWLAFVSETEGDPDLWLARADGTGATRLTRSPGPDWLPRWVRR